MNEEKQYQNTKWFVGGDLKLRQKNSEDGRMVIWISLDNYNICFAMIMYDFIEWCKDLNIDLEIDSSWNNHRGFVIESKDQVLIRFEIERFIGIYNIKPNEDDEKFMNDEWYS